MKVKLASESTNQKENQGKIIKSLDTQENQINTNLKQYNSQAVQTAYHTKGV